MESRGFLKPVQDRTAQMAGSKLHSLVVSTGLCGLQMDVGSECRESSNLEAGLVLACCLAQIIRCFPSFEQGLCSEHTD
jgi:hypothetical protein